MEAPFSAMIALVGPRLEERDGYVAVWVDGVAKAPGVSVWPEDERDKAAAYAVTQANLYQTMLPGYVVAKDSDGYRIYEVALKEEGSGGTRSPGTRRPIPGRCYRASSSGPARGRVRWLTRAELFLYENNGLRGAIVLE